MDGAIVGWKKKITTLTWQFYIGPTIIRSNSIIQNFFHFHRKKKENGRMSKIINFCVETAPESQ